MMEQFNVSANEIEMEMMTEDLSFKSLHNKVMTLDYNNSEVEGMVQSVQLKNREIIKNLGDNRKSRGRYV